MTELLERLSSDHEHILCLLTCLHHELADYREGEESALDLPIIIDTLDYLHNYPDTIHYSLENRLIARLQNRIEEDGVGIILNQITLEHEKISAITIQFLNAFTAISKGQRASISEIMSGFSEYLSIQREHIEKEERVLIPAMRKYLTSEDYEEVEIALAENPDLLFGANAREVYEALYQFIIRPLDRN